MALPSNINRDGDENEQQQEALDYVHRILTTLQRAWRLEYDASKAHGINCIYADARPGNTRDERSWYRTQFGYVKRTHFDAETFWALEAAWREWSRELRGNRRVGLAALEFLDLELD
ncbi:MAG: hypothetical protein Q9162_003053 [Coniocarpon cinnabarinum]